MKDLERFEVREGYAHFRPIGRVTWRSAITLFEQAMAACNENQVTKVIVDTKLLTHQPLTLADRYFLGEALARLWDRSIKLCVVARSDQIDPDRFGWRVAHNRGLDFGLFEDETEAMQWLFELCATTGESA